MGCCYRRSTAHTQWAFVFYPLRDFLPRWPTFGVLLDTVKLWDVGTGTLRHNLEGRQNTVLSMIISPNYQRLATSSGDLTVKIWDVKTATPHRTRSLDEQVTTLEFSDNDI